MLKPDEKKNKKINLSFNCFSLGDSLKSKMFTLSLSSLSADILYDIYAGIIIIDGFLMSLSSMNSTIMFFRETSDQILNSWIKVFNICEEDFKKLTHKICSFQNNNHEELQQISQEVNLIVFMYKKIN